MEKDAQVDPVDIGLAVLCAAGTVWAVSTTDDRSATIAFGVTGLVLGVLCALLLRGKLAPISLAVWIIGMIYGIGVADARPAASYGLLLPAAYLVVPRRFRVPKSTGNTAAP